MNLRPARGLLPGHLLWKRQPLPSLGDQPSTGWGRSQLVFADVSGPQPGRHPLPHSSQTSLLARLLLILGAYLVDFKELSISTRPLDGHFDDV